MATRAVQIFPVIENSRLGLELGRFLVAIGAGYGDVASGQYEMGFLMLGQGKRRRLVAFHRMAAITGVEIWRGSELSRMPVAVAIGATIEFDLE